MRSPQVSIRSPQVSIHTYIRTHCRRIREINEGHSHLVARLESSAGTQPQAPPAEGLHRRRLARVVDLCMYTYMYTYTYGYIDVHIMSSAGTSG